MCILKRYLCFYCMKAVADHHNYAYMHHSLLALASILNCPDAHAIIAAYLQTMRKNSGFQYFDTMALVRASVLYMANFHKLSPSVLCHNLAPYNVKHHATETIKDIEFIVSGTGFDIAEITHYFVIQCEHHGKSSRELEKHLDTKLVSAAIHIILQNADCSPQDLFDAHCIILNNLNAACHASDVSNAS